MLQFLSLYILKEMDWLGRMHLCLIFNSVRIKIIDWCVSMNFKTIHFIGMERPLWLIICWTFSFCVARSCFIFFFVFCFMNWRHKFSNKIRNSISNSTVEFLKVKLYWKHSKLWNIMHFIDSKKRIEIDYLFNLFCRTIKIDH